MPNIAPQKAVYESGYQNAEISASGSEIFFSETNDHVAKSQYNQSFNNLEIINDSPNDLTIELDGLSTRKRTLFGKSAMVMKAEEGIFWNTVKVTNKSSSVVVDAGDVSLIGRIVRF